MAFLMAWMPQAQIVLANLSSVPTAASDQEFVSLESWRAWHCAGTISASRQAVSFFFRHVLVQNHSRALGDPVYYGGGIHRDDLSA
mmetsp:Transcript_126297/g.403677  ORF Transcript_126297/g.403677 Transcript_126297/m.403677 type:complete len:86 (+) Transcript_126297:69-326(+)